MREVQSKKSEPVIRDGRLTGWEWVQVGIVIATFVLLIIARILGWTGGPSQ